MEFSGTRVMMRALNITNIEKIRSRIDKDKIFKVSINDTFYNMTLTSVPTHNICDQTGEENNSSLAVLFLFIKINKKEQPRDN
jgi:hypothetical protein